MKCHSRKVSEGKISPATKTSGKLLNFSKQMKVLSQTATYIS